MGRLGIKILGALLSLGRGRECPLCGWTGLQFLPRFDPRKPSADAFCPKCKSAERHRFAYLVLKDRKPGSVLHFAPERPVAAWLQKSANEYVSCDLEPGKAMAVEDITKLSARDEAFDFIWCSHVLEHIPDDGVAMRELHRVLKPHGLCVVQVPIWRQQTYEDFSIDTREGRLEAFGQIDHVRLYGLDIVDRLEAAGFKVETRRVRDFDLREIGVYGLSHPSSAELFLCTKA